MLSYAVRRLLYAIPLVLAIATAGFFLIHLVPGDPGRTALGPRASAEAVAALNHRFGLDEPLLTQYWHFLGNLVTLDLGISLQYRVPVTELIGTRIAPTALVILYGMTIAVLVAVPLAVVAAVHRDRLADHAIRTGGMTTFVMPPFWFGLMLALVFGLELGLFPTSGYRDGIRGALWSLTLPAIAIGLNLAPLTLRALRAALITTLGSDYIEAARARGLSERRVLYRHALRNSFVSALTVIGVCFVAMIGSSVLIENVFAIPGLGQLLVSAVAARDFPVIQALLVLLGIAVVLVNLLTDLAYAVIDPRIRL